MFFLILSEPETREPAEKSAGLSLVEDALSASFIGVGDLEEGERKRRKKYGNKREANCFCKNCDVNSSIAKLLVFCGAGITQKKRCF